MIDIDYLSSAKDSQQLSCIVRFKDTNVKAETHSTKSQNSLRMPKNFDTPHVNAAKEDRRWQDSNLRPRRELISSQSH